MLVCAMRVPVRTAAVAQSARSFGARIGILSEPASEQRVSVVPSVAVKFIKDGYSVEVESGAGLKSGFTDQHYVDAGCTVATSKAVAKQNDLFFAINAPKERFADLSGKTVVSWVGRMLPEGKETVEAANKHNVSLWDTTAAPRITIAQKLDVLSSQAKLAGHRACIEAAHKYERFHAAEMTAAGKYAPSNTFVLGVGVAGLAAIGTSRALGSVVKAWDVRDVSDQVTSMGAGWVSVDFKEDGAGAGGYAKTSSAEFQAAQKQTFHDLLKQTDIAITTAAIPGRKSPVLIEDYMVKDMKPGSVIVDLAAVGGGNCTLTKQGEVIKTDNGVTIIGYTDLAGRMAPQASSMYAQNMYNLTSHIHGKEQADGFFHSVEKALSSGEDGDIIVRSIVTCKDGALVTMPPPPQPTPVKPKKAVAEKVVAEPNPLMDAVSSSGVASASTAGLIYCSYGVPGSLLNIFALAGAAGYQVVWGVSHALHTPLMAVTNAISGFTAVGGLKLMGTGSGLVESLAVASTALSAINVVGGFVVTQRMLNLFRRPGDADYSSAFLAPGAVMCAVPFFDPKIIDGVEAAAGLMCVVSIGGLAKMTTANAGAKIGMGGVAAGVTTTMLQLDPNASRTLALGSLGAGGAAGLAIGTKVDPLALPQTVAGFHSLVGAAAMATSIASAIAHPGEVGPSMHSTAAILGDFIGGVTLTGSIIAFGKLNGNLDSKPLNLPGKNLINVSAAMLQTGIAYQFLQNGGQLPLWTTAALSNAMGYHLVGSVGGGDMPCCITVLNSYSGWALVAEGFLLNSPMLTVVGSLIGFSGGILTKIMCDAMNRDIMNVLFGGLYTKAPTKSDDGIVREHTETNVEAAAAALSGAKKVLIVPGYGMAVARAQNSVADICMTLRAADIDCVFGIHPVAGRMPGQMNVLLAEAGVPYDFVKEMDEVNPDIEDVDVTLVVGANDITNLAALEDPDCSIAGMPIVRVDQTKKVIFFKRTMGGGYADLENPVFFLEHTDMLLGNAKDTCDQLSAKLKEELKQ